MERGLEFLEEGVSEAVGRSLTWVFSRLFVFGVAGADFSVCTSSLASLSASDLDSSASPSGAS